MYIVLVIKHHADSMSPLWATRTVRRLHHLCPYRCSLDGCCSSCTTACGTPQDGTASRRYSTGITRGGAALPSPGVVPSHRTGRGWIITSFYTTTRIAYVTDPPRSEGGWEHNYSSHLLHCSKKTCVSPEGADTTARDNSALTDRHDQMGKKTWQTRCT